jgi:hypothetical protein
LTGERRRARLRSVEDADRLKPSKREVKQMGEKCGTKKETPKSGCCPTKKEEKKAPCAK